MRKEVRCHRHQILIGMNLQISGHHLLGLYLYQILRDSNPSEKQQQQKKTQQKLPAEHDKTQLLGKETVLFQGICEVQSKTNETMAGLLIMHKYVSLML